MFGVLLLLFVLLLCCGCYVYRLKKSENTVELVKKSTVDQNEQNIALEIAEAVAKRRVKQEGEAHGEHPINHDAIWDDEDDSGDEIYDIGTAGMGDHPTVGTR